MCLVSHVTCHISFFFLDKVVKHIGGDSVSNGPTPSSFYTMHEEFKKVSQFCYEDIVMKSWVVDMNQTRVKLRSLNLHMTKNHEVARKKRVMLSVGDLSLKEQEFLELSLPTPFTYVCCSFCGNKFH